MFQKFISSPQEVITVMISISFLIGFINFFGYCHHKKINPMTMNITHFLKMFFGFVLMGLFGLAIYFTMKDDEETHHG